MSMWKHYRLRCLAAEQELENRKLEQDVLLERMGRLEDRCHTLESQVLQLEGVIRAMRSSRSWRLTLPYRKLGSLVRRAMSIGRIK